MTLTITGPRPMQFANAMLERSAVILLKGFAVNQIMVVPESSVDVTSDKTAVRFCTFFGYFFCASKKSDWPTGQKHRLNSPIH